MHDEFQVIPGYPNYKVNAQGQILNLRTGALQRRSPIQNGSLTVGVTEYGRKTILMVRRVVAEAYLPDFDPRYAVAHKDGDQTNCAADNLEMDFSTRVRGRASARLA